MWVQSSHHTPLPAQSSCLPRGSHSRVAQLHPHLAGCLSYFVALLNNFEIFGNQVVNVNKTFAKGKASSSINAPSIGDPQRTWQSLSCCFLLSSWVDLLLQLLQGKNEVPFLCSMDLDTKGTATAAGASCRSLPWKELNWPSVTSHSCGKACDRACSPSHHRTFIHQMTLHIRFTPETRPHCVGSHMLGQKKAERSDLSSRLTSKRLQISLLLS